MDNDNGKISLPGVQTAMPRWFLFLAVGAVVAILFIRRGDGEGTGDKTDELLISEFNRRLQEQWELFQGWLQQAYPLPTPAPAPAPAPVKKWDKAPKPPKPPPPPPPPPATNGNGWSICQGDPWCEQPPPAVAVIQGSLPVAEMSSIIVQGGGSTDDLRGIGLTESINLGNRQVEYAGVKLPYIVARAVNKLVVQ